MTDPTNTAQIRTRWRDALRKRFRSIRGDIRRWVGYEHDVFGLRQDATLAPDEPADVHRFPSDEGRIAAFTRWLRQRIREGVLEPVSRRSIRDGQHWTATFIRAAYGRGWETATGRLANAGASVSQPDALDVVFDLPVPKRQLRKLYTRAFENLATVPDRAVETVRDTLTEGVAAGWNPRKMASEINKQLRERDDGTSGGVLAHAEMVARTETIYSHNTAALDRYDDAGVQAVQHGEWATADDDRVCPICKRLDGREFPIGEMRTGTFEIAPADLGDDEPPSLAGQYPLRPPAHPNGRCSIIPVI